MIVFSELAKHKIELLNIHITIVWGENDFEEFISNVEKSLGEIEKDPTSCPPISNQNLRICELNEDTYLVYKHTNTTIEVITIYDYRQNPVLVYNDLTEHFHEN